MHIEISDEQPLSSISGFLPYLFAMTPYHAGRHANDVLAAQYVDGSRTKKLLATRDIDERRKVSREFLKLIRDRGMRPGGSFVQIVITINMAGDNRPRDFAQDISSSIGETLVDWAELFDQPIAMTYHMDEVSDKRNKEIYPHIHVAYPKNPDDPNRLERWLKNTILKEQQTDQETT